MKHTIDATNKSMGRVASEAAKLLMGKNTAEFVRNAAPKVSVEITNVSKARISGKKLDTKEYKKYSGYPGGLKTFSMRKVVDDKGFKEVFRKAVYGMLPQNKLKSKMMKNLTISE